MKNKFLKIFIIILMNYYSVPIFYAQTTRVIYTSKIPNVDINSASNDKNKKLNSSEIKKIEEFLNARNNFEFELIYNDSISLYQKIEKLSIDGNQNSQDLLRSLDNEKYYKNLENKEKLHQIENNNFTYNITIPFEEYKWVITNETKIINGHLCYKATTTKEEIYNPYKGGKVSFTPVAWFTPEIPASFGPKGLDGLPGLILEASINGKRILYANKIEFNILDSLIEKPKGKNITQKEYENILIENYENDN